MQKLAMPLEIPITAASGPTTIELDWDSRHLGQRVGRIDAQQSSDLAIADSLAQAQQQGYRLVYLSTAADHLLPAELLQQFGGELVDRKVTFSRILSATETCAALPLTPWRITSYTEPAASTQMIALAVAAGEYSRFGADRIYPRDRFIEMYRLWVERSVRRELAADVLVATRDGNEPAGMITLAIDQNCGVIGLIAVDAQYRGQGIGRLLMQAATTWMVGRQLSTAKVTTQLNNHGACQLYLRSGYEQFSLQNMYHFWL
ncbi:MAG: GNAT family N-acetyltransferase [Planctomycetota bacterium]|nr:GNAT family N-acetyltransferase [Planctomycetota bacterium]